MAITFAAKLALYIDDTNDTESHKPQFTVTGYHVRPDYRYFKEYSKDKKYGTTYNADHHEQVLKTWETDLQNNKYNIRRVNQNIAIGKLLALEAIEEYTILHGSKANVSSRQMRNRDEEAKQLVKQCGYEKYDVFVMRAFKQMYIHNKEFKKKVNQIVLPHIVELLNKGVKNRELDPDQVELYFTPNICAHNSVRDQNTMRIGLWEQYLDKKTGTWKKRRKKDPNGVFLSYGVSPNQFKNMMVRIFEKYPSLIYSRPQESLWHLTICPYHEENLKVQYESELAALSDGEKLTIKPAHPLNNELQIDAFPMPGCIFQTATHFLWVPYEFFSKPPPPMLTIIPAFTTVTDKSDETTKTLEILEPYHQIMEKGVTIPSLNLPIEIIIKLQTFVGGDGVLMAWIRGCANHNFLYGKLFNTVLFTKDKSIETIPIIFPYKLCPTWFKEGEFLSIWSYKRIDNWKNLQYRTLPQKFVGRFCFGTHQVSYKRLCKKIKDEYKGEFSHENKLAAAKDLKQAVINDAHHRAFSDAAVLDGLHCQTGLSGFISSRVEWNSTNQWGCNHPQVEAAYKMMGVHAVTNNYYQLTKLPHFSKITKIIDLLKSRF